MSKKTVKARTLDTFTLDQATVDAAGVFFQHELERIDPTLNEPLVDYTWTRDVPLREDVNIADEIASFTFIDMAHVGNINANGKNWISPNDTAIAGPAVDVTREGQPLHLWGSEIKYTIVELAKARQVNRPVDTQLIETMKLKWQMDNDEMVYKGDKTVSAEGILNSTKVSVTTPASGVIDWSPTGPATPDTILADINEMLQTAWHNAAYAVMPSRLLVSPNIFGRLVNMKVSTAGNLSVMNYLKENNILRAKTGKELEIVPLKWATGAGVDATYDRMFLYDPNPRFIRYPIVPLQRTPIYPKSIWLTSTYYGKMGHVEFRYPQTMLYMDTKTW